METTAPRLRATILAVLIHPRQPRSCGLSSPNIPPLSKAVKPSNGHPQRVLHGAARGGAPVRRSRQDGDQALLGVFASCLCAHHGGASALGVLRAHKPHGSHAQTASLRPSLAMRSGHTGQQHGPCGSTCVLWPTPVTGGWSIPPLRWVILSVRAMPAGRRREDHGDAVMHAGT